jgi:peptidoglycan/LPS O-acetylase OafA/YrhL
LAWKCCKWLPLSGFLYALILTIYLVNGVYITYWKYAPLLSEAIAIAMVFGLAAWCSKRQKKGWLLYFGKLSFPVYLLHTPIAGIISNLCNRYELYVLTFLRPMIVIGITLIVIEVIIFLGKKLKVGKIVNYMIGVNR